MWNKKIYLCGSMTGLKHGGAGWRKSFSRWLSQRGQDCYNPCTAEAEIAKLYGVKSISSWDWNKLPQPMQEDIIRKDLNQIRYGTKYVICYFTKYSTGTVSELTWAHYFGIPIYTVTQHSLRGWPATATKTNGNAVFNNFDKLKRFLIYKYKLRKQ